MSFFKSRIAVLTVVALTATTAWSQDIVTEINNGGNINIEVPAGLTVRNNKNVGKAVVSGAESTGKPQAAANTNQQQQQPKKKVDESRRLQNTTSQTRQGKKVGFRIQVMSDNTPNGKANVQQRARMIAMKFPQYRPYISYNAPSWRLRIGDFAEREDASAALSRVRAAFPGVGGMSIIKDNINLWSK